MKHLTFVLLASLIFTVCEFNQAFAQDDYQDLAIVSINEYVNQTTVGAVYIYDQNYSLIKILDSPEKLTAGQFSGDVVYWNNQLILETASREKVHSVMPTEPLFMIGAVSIFDGTTGSLIKTIWNPEPNTIKDQVGGAFGQSVAHIGNNIVIGNSARDVNGIRTGAVYIFDNAGNLLSTINDPNPNIADNFGRNLVAWNDKFAVSVEGRSVGNTAHAGVVSIYDANTNSLIKTIDNPNPTPYARFGSSIDVSGDILLIAAPFTTVDGDENVGEVYLYDANTGNLIKTIKNPDPDDGDHFGRSVLFAGDKIVIGAIGDGVFDEGSVYIYDKSGNLINTIHSPDKSAKSGFYSNEFGVSLSFTGNKLAIGDDNKMVNGIRAGAVYVYDITNGKLLQTIDNPDSNESAFGYFQEFVGNMEPDSNIVSKITKAQKSITENNEEVSKNDTGSITTLLDEPQSIPNTDNNTDTTSEKTIKWLNENGADYRVWGMGVIRLDNSDLNINKTLIDIPTAHVWSDTDPKGIPVDMIETGADTGVFYADIIFSSTESSHLQLQVSSGDTITASFEDESTNESLVDTTQILLKKYVSPSMQLELGVPMDEIQCKEGLILTKNARTGDPLCLKPQSVTKLKERHWID